MIRRMLLASGAVLLVLTTAAAQSPFPGGIGRRPILDNATVEVSQLLLVPGAREGEHVHASPLVIVRLPGGQVEFLPANTSHSLNNTGSAALEAVVVTLKPNRVRGGTAPALPAPPGITGRAILGNPDVAISRVEFSPSAREPVHSHPYDLLAIPLRGAMMELQLGTRKETRGYAAGEAIFMPRDQPHAVANPASETFAVIAIAVR